MRQVLFRVPLDGSWDWGPFGNVPVFGMGLVLIAWVLFGLFWLYQNRALLAMIRQRSFSGGFGWLGAVLFWGVVAVVIVMLPQWVHRGTDQTIADTTQAITQLEATANSFKTAKERQQWNVEYEAAYEARDAAWRSKRDFQSAITAYEAEIVANPERLQAYYRLIWILATAPDETVRDGKRAVLLSQKIEQRMAREHSTSLDIRAAAYAENGDFEKAVQLSQRASRRAAAMKGLPRTAEIGHLNRIRHRMGLYKNQRAYRDEFSGVAVPVFGYGVMLFFGFVCSGGLAIRHARLVGIPKETIWDVVLWLLVAGIGGARLFHIVQYRAEVFDGKNGFGENFIAAINLREGGLVLYGGVILGLIAFLLFCFRRRLSPLLMTDILVPSFFVGLAFGRFGCFMNGCCYGDRCELPWSVTFPLGSVPDIAMLNNGFVNVGEAVTLSLHPSQIYSSINALILALLMSFYFKVRRRDGALLGLALFVYPVARFLIEFLRGDEMGQFNTSLTISQWVSVSLFLLGIVYWAWLLRRPIKVTTTSNSAASGSAEQSADKTVPPSSEVASTTV